MRRSGRDLLCLSIFWEVLEMTLEDRLAYLESHDALTGLYNWQKYHKTLKILEKEVPKAVGFVYLDINGLQSINRNFGYDYGDIILNRIAKVLQKCFEKSEIYRIGVNLHAEHKTVKRREKKGRNVERLNIRGFRA